MFEKFYPNEYYHSAYEIDYERFYRLGYRGILFDIDNTLVCHGEPADERSMELFSRLVSLGYQAMLMSNNKEPRVKSFADKIGSKYIFKAGKPGTKNYFRGMELMGTDSKNTLFVGDQLFTDILGAKKAGIHTLLVRPIHPKEEIQIVIKRYLEKIVLREYKKRQRSDGI